jgi:hypothetical protein
VSSSNVYASAALGGTGTGDQCQSESTSLVRFMAHGDDEVVTKDCVVHDRVKNQNNLLCVGCWLTSSIKPDTVQQQLRLKP